MNFSVPSITKCVNVNGEKTLIPAFLMGIFLRPLEAFKNTFHADCTRTIRSVKRARLFERRFEPYKTRSGQPGNNVVFTQTRYFLSRFELPLSFIRQSFCSDYRYPYTSIATKPVKRIVCET